MTLAKKNLKRHEIFHCGSASAFFTGKRNYNFIVGKINEKYYTDFAVIKCE
ncbi:MAG: hypothetical protein WCQ99_16360 [Pseudomonadota bacterium]